MRENRTVAIKFFFSATEAAKLLTFSQSLNAPAIVFHRISIDFLDSARSPERFAALSS
jgi:hypothetical protein